MARAEGSWLQEIQAKQPGQWKDVEWWICPSYYTPDPLLARVFGPIRTKLFRDFRRISTSDRRRVSGPVRRWFRKQISVFHVQKIAKRLKHPLLLWDNYPVNDLSMRDELHLGPLQGRDPKLPRVVYGYLSNPLLQENLSFIPLATCFDYAADPIHYQPESSWKKIVRQVFGADALPLWRILRRFCEEHQRAKKTKRSLRFTPVERQKLKTCR